LRYITIGRYQFSMVLVLIAVVSAPLAFAAAYYLWSSRTIPLSIEEPLSVSDFPSSIHFHPGENATIEVVIENVATVSYTVELAITLSDPAYQAVYAQISDYTYEVAPGNNTVTAWIYVSKDAPPATMDITVDFFRQ